MAKRTPGEAIVIRHFPDAPSPLEGKFRALADAIDELAAKAAAVEKKPPTDRELHRLTMSQLARAVGHLQRHARDMSGYAPPGGIDLIDMV